VQAENYTPTCDADDIQNIQGFFFSHAERFANCWHSTGIKHGKHKPPFDVEHIDPPSAPVLCIRTELHGFENEMNGIPVCGRIVGEQHPIIIGEHFGIRDNIEVIPPHLRLLLPSAQT
jgi:hypothetical protein